MKALEVNVFKCYKFFARASFCKRCILFQPYSRFPERRSQNERQNPQEYSHAEEFLRSFPNEREVLTLSKSEWEAISLYLVFAFEKTTDYEL